MRKPAFIILTLLQPVVREAREAQLVVARTKHDFRTPMWRKVAATVLKEEL